MTSTPPDVVVTEVDPHDDDLTARWHQVMATADREALGDDATTWTLPELRVQLSAPRRRHRSTIYAGWVDGELVATGSLGVPLLDNLTTAEVDVHVAAAHRRRGIGTAVLADLEARAAALGRTVLDGEVTWSYGLGAEGGGSPGREFARARGYDLVLGDVQRALELPVDEGLLERLAAEAAPHHTAYSLRSWVGPVGDDIVLSWARLSTTLNTEAPTGEREIEAEAVDVESLREGEDMLAAQGRSRFHTVALDTAGEVVAYTDVVTTVHEPGRGYQWGTLVRRDVRGHRLGLAVKAANLHQVQREAPELRRLDTWNAEVNQHMIGVNEQLGFRPVARLGEFQKKG